MEFLLLANRWFTRNNGTWEQQKNCPRDNGIMPFFGGGWGGGGGRG